MKLHRYTPGTDSGRRAMAKTLAVFVGFTAFNMFAPMATERWVTDPDTLRPLNLFIHIGAAVVAAAILYVVVRNGIRAEVRASKTLADLVENMSDAFYYLDTEDRFLIVNKKTAAITKLPAADVIGRKIWDFVPAELHPQFEEPFAAARRSGTVQRRQVFSPFSGTWYDFIVHPRHDGLAVFFQDVTAQRRTDELLQDSQKSELVGQIAGGVAHDFNNLLSVIIPNVEDLADHLKDQPDAAEQAQMVLKAAHSGADLVRRLLTYARRREPENVGMNLAQKVEDFTKLVRRTLPTSVELIVTCADAPLPPIAADVGLLENALLNLIVNARDALAGHGQITIDIRAAHLDAAFCGRHLGLTPGPYVKLTVSDNGHGIPEAVRKRIFEPFFTTKPSGKGTGLGLSMVHSFMKDARGVVEVTSEIDAGTSFELYFPAVEDGSAASIHAHVAGEAY